MKPYPEKGFIYFRYNPESIEGPNGPELDSIEVINPDYNKQECLVRILSNGVNTEEEILAISKVALLIDWQLSEEDALKCLVERTAEHAGNTIKQCLRAMTKWKALKKWLKQTYQSE